MEQWKRTSLENKIKKQDILPVYTSHHIINYNYDMHNNSKHNIIGNNKNACFKNNSTFTNILHNVFKILCFYKINKMP